MQFMVLIMISLMVVGGCNKYTRYRVLRVVFDGVPHPDEELKARETDVLKAAVERADQQRRAPSLQIRYTHPSAGAAGNCSLCHGTLQNLIIPGKDMCVRCHVRVREQFPFLHGPAVLDCIVCHDPHESKIKSLLKIIGNELCFECHYRKDKEEAFKAEAHKEYRDKKFVCLACHDPHGGKDRFFVKEGTPAPPEAVQEESAPGGIIEEETLRE